VYTFEFTGIALKYIINAWFAQFSRFRFPL